MQPAFVGRLLGFDSSKGVVYAQDKMSNGSYIATKDGTRWMSVSEKEVRIWNRVFGPVSGNKLYQFNYELN